MVAVNIREVFAAAQEAPRHMGQGGRIITIGSVNAERMPFAGGGVLRHDQSGRRRSHPRAGPRPRPRGITVDTVQPGPTATDMNPADGPFAEAMKGLTALGRFGESEEIAALLNSKGTLEAVKFMQAFWKDACDEGGLAWDDTNNNRAFHAGEISASLNGASIYLVAKRQKDKIKDERGEPMWPDIDHAPLPAGPAGRLHLYEPHSHAIMKYSKHPKLAKDFLRWLHRKEHFEKWFVTQEAYSVSGTKAWETHAMWDKVDGPLKMFRQASRSTRIFGYAGPATAKKIYEA